MARTLVTGGTGLVGRFIVEHLLDAGHDVTVAGRTEPADGVFSRPVEFMPFDLDPDTIGTLSLSGVDHLVHAAFCHEPGKYRGGEGDDPVGFRRANLDGSVVLFETAKAAGLKRCVFLSSRAVYGAQPPGMPLTEDTKPHPETLYGEVKHDAERSLAAMSSPGFVTASLRVTGVYGPAGRGGPHKWQALFDDFIAGRPVSPRCGTEVHGGDMAAAVGLMLDAKSDLVGGKIFNVSDILVDRRDLLDIVNIVLGASHGLPERADATAVNAMTCDRLRALGWRPGGHDRLRRTIAELLAAT